MQFDKSTLEKGLGNALVRAYIIRDFVLPLKGYTLKELVGNQSVRLPGIYEDNENFLQVIDNEKEITTFPVEGPVIGQKSLMTFHLWDGRPIQEVTGQTTIEGSRIYYAVTEIALQEDSEALDFLLVFHSDLR